MRWLDTFNLTDIKTCYRSPRLGLILSGALHVNVAEDKPDPNDQALLIFKLDV